MATILQEISQWAAKLPYWEQAALEKVLTSASLADEEYDQLLQYLLEDADLAPRSPDPRPVLTFSQLAVEETRATGASQRLSKISNLRHVNALVPDQVLTFGPAMTVIFGANGSGKSGYARVLGSAAFTRGDKQVLRNVTEPASDNQEVSADIELTDGTAAHTICYKVGTGCPDMHCFYVFDSTSVRAHLTHANAMSFSPGGLAHLTRLADTTEKVRQRLDTRITERTRSNPFAFLFPGETEVAELIALLNYNTAIDALSQLGTLSDEEIGRISALDQHIARLKSESIAEQIAEIGQAVADLERLASQLAVLEHELGDDQLAGIVADLAEWHARDAAARLFSTEQFKTDYFSQIGSDLWIAFITAARDLAIAESAGGPSYPEFESRCLLCHQPLPVEARDLLHRLWAYLASDAQARLADTESALARRLAVLDGVDLRFLSDDTVAYRHLQVQDEDTLLTAQKYLDVCRRRRDQIVQAVRKHTDLQLESLPNSGRAGVEAVIGQLRDKRAKLEQRNVADEIARLDSEKTVLEQRRLLGQYLAQIEEYVGDCKWTHQAGSAGVRRSTRHITQKYNELFGQLVTQRYLALFSEMLVQLNCPRQVRVETRGEKGKTVKQIVLEAHKDFKAEAASPDKVLSEGEQRAVALADFLTEVALDDSSTGVILDDPVTSLDFAWKETIARHLVGEAKRRQVIIFTHDLHFTFCLKDCADQEGVTVAGHWIEKRDDRPGWVFLDNAPVCEKEYKSTARADKFYQQAKSPGISPDQQQSLLQQGFAALRTCYEAFVVFDLFAEVVMRFGERISIDRLKKVAVDLTIRDEVIQKVGLLSRYIEGHLHSDTYIAQKPTPQLLKQEIDAFQALKNRHKQFKVSVGIKD